MIKIKKTMAAILLSLAGITTTVHADCWDPCDECYPDITVGVDWLYWQPCISGQHFALETVNTSDPLQVRTHYFGDEWDSGTRVYVKVGNYWNGFSGALIYTYFNPDGNGDVSTELPQGLTYSYPVPGVTRTGESISSSWEMEYQTLDALVSCFINVSGSPCMKIEAFSGLTWIDVTQGRKDVLTDSTAQTTTDYIFQRHHNFWAIGPAFGVNTSYRFCDCFDIFGTIKTSLVVGEGDNTDTFLENDPSNTETPAVVTGVYSAKDECFCFPGLHLVAGISYELHFCDTTFALRLGWEYVQWINAPSFPFYEQNETGIRSAPIKNDLTMQGIFVGVNSTF